MRKVGVAAKGVPYITTHDGRTIRYPDPLTKVNDTVMVDIATGKIKDFIKFDSGKTHQKRVHIVVLGICELKWSTMMCEFLHLKLLCGTKFIRAF